MKIVKQSVGIDCSKDELVTCFAVMDEDFEISYKATQIFSNTKKGFEQLVKFACKILDCDCKICFVVEVTGVYHQALAEYLYDGNYPVSVVLPNKANRFAQTLNVRTVTDKTASHALATMGLEKKLDMWKKPDPVHYGLKKLTRERSSLIDERTQIKNELHAETSGAWPSKRTIERISKRISFINKQITEIENEIQGIIKSYPWLAEKIKKICSVKGLGWLTVITIVSETDGFNLVTNRGQLVSYAGYDVIEKQSGTSVKGKSKISKKGNKHIRRALHFPALTAVKHDQRIGMFYKRLEDRQKIKMKAYTAVQRKLLMLIYTLWKKDQVYDPAFYKKETDIKYSGQPTRATLTELTYSGS